MLTPKCKGVEAEIKSLIKVWFQVMASLCYCYFISSKIPKGKLRFLSLTPVLFLYTILPLQLSSVLPTGITSFFITWLSSFKLLLFTFDLGPLSSSPPKSLPLFLCFASLPIRGTGPLGPSGQKPTKEKLHHTILLPLKALIFVSLLVGLNDHKQKLSSTAVVGLYCSLAYLLLDVVLGFSNILAYGPLGIELELPSDEPYMSTSLQDFWGRRWNLIVTNTLRHTVFVPVRTALWTTILGPQWASVAGVLASFMVSGLMHELMFFHITRAAPTGMVTCFFVLHGVCVVVEYFVKKRLGHIWKLHWLVSGPITVAFVVATVAWLFLPPVLRNRVDERSIKEFRNLVDCILENF